MNDLGRSLLPQLSILLGVLMMIGIVSISNKNTENLRLSMEENNLANVSASKSFRIDDNPALLTKESSKISAKAYLLARENGDDEQVIIAESAEEKLPIASVTKLTTAVVALENIPESEEITIEKSDLNHQSPSGLLKAGDKLKRDELIKAMLIESNNDAAWALSRTLGEHEFIFRMNKLATELGMANTSYINPVGLDSENIVNGANISSAHDLLLLVKYIKKNHPVILSYSSLPKADIMNTNGAKSHQAVSTDILLSKKGFPYEIIGGKTGQTDLAKKNLVLIIKDPKNPENYIVSVVLGSDDHFKDTESVLDVLK